MILSLVATVASSYLQLRGLDEQLVDRAAHARRLRRVAAADGAQVQVRPRVSEMNVEQAKARYQTAAAQIPRDPPRHRGARERAVDPARPQSRADSARQGDLRARAAGDSGGRALGAARAPARPAAGRAAAHRRQRADRRRQGAVLPDDLADRRARHREHRSVEPVQGAGAHVELRRRRSPGRSSPAVRSPGRLRRPRRRRRPRCSPTSSPSRTRSPTSTTRSSRARRSPSRSPSRRSWCEALRGYSRLAQALFDGGRTPYSTVLQAEEQLFPAELDWAAARAQLCVSLVEHLQGDGRRLGDDRGKADHARGRRCRRALMNRKIEACSHRIRDRGVPRT